jgi:flagellar motility protein MotE (MotC chaperone)
MRLLPGIWLLRATMAAIALLLLVKTATLVQQAAAAVPDVVPAAAPPSQAATPAAAPPVIPLPSGQACPPAPSSAELALLGDLRARKAALDQRETSVAGREQALAAADKQFSTRLAELTSLQKRIEDQQAARNAAASADTEKLVQLYEVMKPADAATIFNDLDRDVLLPVLDAMNVRRAAPILAAMTPERARLVTAELAAMRGRRDALLAPAPAPQSAPPAPPQPASAAQAAAPATPPATGE